MRILIGCEFTGIVRDNFRRLGHEAWSCDLQDSEGSNEFHIKKNILDILDDNWDMMIVFPPCTNLCCSGARYFKFKQEEQKKDLKFIKTLLESPINKICLENPVGIISTRIRKPDQIIQPYQFGHEEIKTTCLWLKNLPKLVPIKIVKPLRSGVHKYAGNKNKHSMDRSRTYPGIAYAMANQWNNV